MEAFVPFFTPAAVVLFSWIGGRWVVPLVVGLTMISVAPPALGQAPAQTAAAPTVEHNRTSAAPVPRLVWVLSEGSGVASEARIAMLPGSQARQTASLTTGAEPWST